MMAAQRKVIEMTQHQKNQLDGLKEAIEEVMAHHEHYDLPIYKYKTYDKAIADLGYTYALFLKAMRKPRPNS